MFVGSSGPLVFGRAPTFKNSQKHKKTCMQWFMWRNPSCSNLVQSKFCWQLPFVHTDGTEGHGVFLVSNQRFELLDLCMVMFYGFYHGKSSLNHHLGEFFTFSEHLKQIQEFWWFEWCFHFGFRDTPLAHSDAPETFWEVERAHFDGRLATCVPKKLMTGLWFQIFFLCSPRKLGKIFTPFDVRIFLKRVGSTTN